MKNLVLKSLLLLALAARVHAEAPLKIGFIFPLSGEFARYGVSSANAVTLASENDKGSPVEIFFEDNHTCAAPESVGAYRKLVGMHQVDAVVTFCTAAAKAILPIAKADKIPLFQLTEPGVPDDTYMLKMMPDATGMLVILGERFALKYKKMAILASTMEVNTSENGNVALFTKAFTKHGGSIVSSEEVPTDLMDFRSIILKVKTSGAEAITPFLWDPKQMAHFLKQSDDLALWSGTKLAGNFIFEMMFNDLINLYPKLKQLDGLESANFTQSTSADFTRQYKSRFHEDPQQFSDYAFDVVERIKICTLDQECLRKPFDGASGHNEFDNNGRRQGSFIEKKLFRGQFIPADEYDRSNKN